MLSIRRRTEKGTEKGKCKNAKCENIFVENRKIEENIGFKVRHLRIMYVNKLYYFY